MGGEVSKFATHFFTSLGYRFDACVWHQKGKVQVSKVVTSQEDDSLITSVDAILSTDQACEGENIEAIYMNQTFPTPEVRVNDFYTNNTPR